EVETLTGRGRVIAAMEESLAEIIDVDRVQPDRMGTDRTKPVPENRVEERQQVQIAGPVDEPRPCDDGWKAIGDRVANRQLGLRLRRLVDVRRAHRSVLVRWPLARHSEHAGGAAVDESGDA